VFVHYEKNTGMLPIKVWLPEWDSVEDGCKEQVMNVAKLPFAFHHIVLCPDTHQGFGVPIGCVLATENVILPGAVGQDCGCGMRFISTNIPAKLLRSTETGQGSLIQAIIGCIMRNVPVGFAHHKEKQQCLALDRFVENEESSYYIEELMDGIDKGYYQVGTLGGGKMIASLLQ
jgi:tRNA-splicing ligase RtcB